MPRRRPSACTRLVIPQHSVPTDCPLVGARHEAYLWIIDDKAAGSVRPQSDPCPASFVPGPVRQHCPTAGDFMNAKDLRVLQATCACGSYAPELADLLRAARLIVVKKPATTIPATDPT